MARKQTAIVLVKKEWMNDVRHLLNEGQKSESTDDVHAVVAPVESVSDHRGLWLRDVTTTQLKADGSPIKMKFMIPWPFVVAVALVDDEKSDKAVGFRDDRGTTLLVKPQP